MEEADRVENRAPFTAVKVESTSAANITPTGLGALVKKAPLRPPPVPSLPRPSAPPGANESVFKAMKSRTRRDAALAQVQVQAQYGGQTRSVLMLQNW